MQRWKWMQSSPSPQVEALGASRQERLLRLIAQPFAHRGLHGDGRVENSVAAFEAAIAAGHGFELDVQETADGQARSEEHTSELQSLMRISYAVFCVQTKKPQRRRAIRSI